MILHRAPSADSINKWSQTRHALGLKIEDARNLLLSRAIANSILVLSTKSKQKYYAVLQRCVCWKGRPFCTEKRLYMYVCVCSRQEQEVCASLCAWESEFVLGSRTVVTAAPFLHFPVLALLFHLACFALCNGWVCEFPESYFLLRACSVVLVLKCLHYCV